MTAAAFLGVLGGLYAVLRVAHGVADYWGQTQRQADTKGQPGWVGRRACLAHVAVHVWVSAVLLGAALWAFPAEQLGGAGYLLGGLAVIAGSHYFADRRAPLRRLSAFVRRGRGMEWVDDHGGLALLDQEWHRWWLLVAAAIMAAGVAP